MCFPERSEYVDKLPCANLYPALLKNEHMGFLWSFMYVFEKDWDESGELSKGYICLDPNFPGKTILQGKMFKSWLHLLEVRHLEET